MAIIDGRIISVRAFRALRIAIMVVGIICTEEELITISIVRFFLLDIFLVAFIPAGTLRRLR